MHEKYEQWRGAVGDIFVFILTITKINDNTQSELSRKYKETRSFG